MLRKQDSSLILPQRRRVCSRFSKRQVDQNKRKRRPHGLQTAQTCCDWYGVICNKLEQVVELNLTRNNLVGTMNASKFFAPLNKLKVLMIDFNLFCSLRSLIQVNLSHNELSGEVDVLFVPALQSLNLSGNNFALLICSSSEHLRTFSKSQMQVRMIFVKKSLEFQKALHRA